MMARYRKAIAALLSGAVGVAALFVPGIDQHVTPDVIAAASTLLGTLMVYAVPNA